MTTKSTSKSASKSTRQNGAAAEFELASDHAIEAARTARSALGKGLEEARDASGEAYEKAKEKGEALYADGDAAVRAAKGQAEEMVRKNPTTAVLGALGVGLLIGLAVRSRGDA